MLQFIEIIYWPPFVVDEDLVFLYKRHPTSYFLYPPQIVASLLLIKLRVYMILIMYISLLHQIVYHDYISLLRQWFLKKI